MGVSKWLLLVSLLSLSACKWDVPVLGSEALPEGVKTGIPVDPAQWRCSVPLLTGVTAENMQCASAKVSYPKGVGEANPAAVDAINQFVLSQLVEFSDEQGKQATSLEELASMFIADY